MKNQPYLERKIARIETYWSKYKKVLLKDEDLKKLLLEYLSCFDFTQKVFHALHIDEICAQCGQTPQVCCGIGMELYCEDPVLLLNKYLKIKFPPLDKRRERCFFWTPKGCILKVRSIMCRKFFCDELQEMLSLRDKSYLQKALKKEEKALSNLFHRLEILCPELAKK